MNEFEPRINISERYSLENIAKQHGMNTIEFKKEIDKQMKLEQDMINEQTLKGLSYEQAQCHVMRCLYIDGFSGPTFK